MEAAQKKSEVLVALVVMWFKEDITTEPDYSRTMDPVMVFGGMSGWMGMVPLRSFFESLISS